MSSEPVVQKVKSQMESDVGGKILKETHCLKKTMKAIF